MRTAEICSIAAAGVSRLRRADAERRDAASAATFQADAGSEIGAEPPNVEEVTLAGSDVGNTISRQVFGSDKRVTTTRSAANRW